MMIAPCLQRSEHLSCRVPVAAAWLLLHAAWVPLQRTTDNYFLLEKGGPFAFPAKVRLQSVLGDIVVDTVPHGPVGTGGTFAGVLGCTAASLLCMSHMHPHGSRMLRTDAEQCTHAVRCH